MYDRGRLQAAGLASGGNGPQVISIDCRLLSTRTRRRSTTPWRLQALLRNGTTADIASRESPWREYHHRLVNARDHGLPLPAAAFVMSPCRPTLSDDHDKREVMLLPASIPRPGADCTAGRGATQGLISPIFADLSGLPLIIGRNPRPSLETPSLARQAATADVGLPDITPGAPRLQAYYPILDEAAAALDRAGLLLSAHLAGAERVTA